MNELTYNNAFEAEQPENNYKAEGDELIENLKNNATYCHDFFFDSVVADGKGGTKKKPCQIAPLRSKTIYDLKSDFDVEVKEDDFSTILFQAVWAEGSWQPLSSWEGRSSFYGWLKKVARNAVVDRLEEEGFINSIRSRTVGNMRLTMKSQPALKCKMLLDDTMVGSKYYGLLTAIYVDKLSKEDIMKVMHLTDDEYEANKKAGENKLKDALIRFAEYDVEEFIHEKKKHVVMVSSEVVANQTNWCKSKTEVNPLADVFGIDLTDDEVRVKTMKFLYDFSEKLWNEKTAKRTAKKTCLRDRYIWWQRFVKNIPAAKVAKEVGHDYKWLNTRYSRLNKVFKAEIRKWWVANAA